MKPEVNQPYTISRIRLINFHNLVNETIPVADGGHLFLLGDNGSGKTTILDAVHYVLTAGESMEFNAAARVAGRQTEGRRIQGIIMRYNVDTGSIKRTGGVTYAALELAGRLGRPITVGIGMSVTAIDESVQRWGVIRECPLEEIPFLVEETGGTRPRTRDEMKQALGESSGFYSIGAYRTEIASRLFGGDELFGEVCSFLKMGKAYREIAARAGDYHELFKSLLPEPKTELFDRIIVAMRALDGSRVDLDDLERKAAYLRELELWVKAVDDARDEKLRYAWLIPHLRLGQLEAERAAADADVARRHDELSALAEAETQKKLELTDFRRRLDDQKAKDTNGLVRQEKECTADLERTEGIVGKRKADTAQADKHLRETQKKWNRERDALTDRLRKFSSDVGRVAPTLPFRVTELQAALDTAHRAAAAADPATVAEGLPVTAIATQAESALSQRRTALAQTEAVVADTRRSADSARQAVEELEKQTEATPELPHFGAARARLRTSLMEAQPLYEGLEWQPGLARSTMAAVEELIGDAVLGTLLVPERDWDAARELVYGEFPALRLARGPSPPTADRMDIPDWIRANFDLAKSTPAAIECLAQEMAARQEPRTENWKQWRVALFRAHECRLQEKPPRLVGIESRRQEWKRQLQLHHLEARELRKVTQAAETRLAELQQEVTQLEAFQGLLRQHGEDVRRAATAVTRCGLESKFADATLVRQRSQCDEVMVDEKRYRQRLTELRSLIARENLDQLEQRIQKLQRQITSAEEVLGELAAQRGRIDSEIKGARDRISESQAHAATAQAELARLHKILAIRHPDLVHDAIPDYVLRTRKGQQFKTVDAVSKAAADSARGETEAVTRLDERVKDPLLGAPFGFYYEKDDNRLLDRRSQTLANVSTDLQAKLAEQRELINERTHELFRNIIMAELVVFLKQHVNRLNDMAKKVNQLLAGREFGGSRYRLQLTPAPAHARILEIVRNHNPFETAATEQELRDFFADHKDGILGADVSRIPDVLDYRNWYLYEMKIHAAGAEGVIMDRRMKSVGSGGEQAVPNYLLILTIAHFLYQGTEIKLHTLLFDEAFYGIDAARRDQILGFATDLGLQLLVTSPDQDGVKREVRHSTSVLVVKDKDYNVHLYPFLYENRELPRQLDLLEPNKDLHQPAEFGAELTPNAGHE